jgi:hypothetical protein
MIAVVPVVSPRPAGADAGVPEPVTATIEGRVSTFADESLDALGPLPGALVELLSRGETFAVTRTDADARYRFAGLPSRGDYRLRFSAPGHETTYFHNPYGDPWDTPGTPIRIGEHRTIDFGLHRRNSTIRGRVTDPAGRPLAGVDVLEAPPAPVVGAGPYAYPEYRTSTDADGRFEMLVPARSLRLLAERPDLVRRWWPGVLHPHATMDVLRVPDGQARSVDFRLEPRPARSCWAAGGFWIAGTTDTPAPSFPPDAGDSCTGALAPPGPLRVANVGPHLVGGQRMDLIEMMEATMLPQQDGRTPPRVRLVGQPAPASGAAGTGAAPPRPSAPAGRPVVPATLTGSTRLAVRGGRFVARATCPRGASCSGELRATVRRVVRRRAQTVTVARRTVRAGTGRRTVELRLNATGRRLLRAAHGPLRATIRWSVPGGSRTVRSVRLEAR